MTKLHSPAETAERPMQYFLAEELDADWLQQKGDALWESRESVANERRFSHYQQIASNNLEQGINSGNHEWIEDACSGFTYLIEQPEYDLVKRAFFNVRTWLAAKDSFIVRADREQLQTATMSSVYKQVMDVLEEVRDNPFQSQNSKHEKMLELITFGSLARLRRSDCFPYFSTYRESRGDLEWANHDSLPNSLREIDINVHLYRCPRNMHASLLVSVTYECATTSPRRYGYS
jgi:hypothetical protein